MSRFPVVIAVAVLLGDAVTKYLARVLLPPGGVGPSTLFALHVVDNSGGPLGLGPLWLTIVASLVVLGIVVRRPLRPAVYSPRYGAGLGLLLGGGLANLAERILVGRTTDMLVLGNLTALNFADVAILFGMVGLLWPAWREGAHAQGMPKERPH